jgi:S1 RNA binding domain protein
MSLEVGSIVEGVITGITNYGAFVRLPEGCAGLIHISEVADTYVDDIHKYLKEKDTVMVKILGINNKGKYDLSLKQAAKETKAPQESPRGEAPERPFPRERRNDDSDEVPYPPPPLQKGKNKGFEDMIGRFIKESDERLLDLKRNTESKRGRGKGR